VIANGYLRLDRDEWVRLWGSVPRRSPPFPQPFPRAVSEPVPPDTMRTTRSAPPRHETEPHDTG
jgi:hypothetical protein